MNQCIKRLSPYITILASGVIAYRNVIFSSGPAMEIHDISVLFYPTYFFVKNAFIAGQIPFWDPHLVFGQPLLFNFGLGLLYLPFLLFLYLSGTAYLIPRHMELFIIAHLIFSGITMYCGLRKIGVERPGACLGGMVFQLSAGSQDMFIIPPMVFGLPWVPLAVFYFFSCLSAEDTSKRNRLKDGAILILSYFMLISSTHPHLLAYTYFQTFLIALFFIIYYLSRKNLVQILNCIKRCILYPITPVFLSAFIILPILRYLPYTTRWVPVEGNINIGPLYKSYFPTMFLPMLTRIFSAPYAYTGILTLLLTCGYCLLVNTEDRKKGYFFWVLSAVFWVLFSIEGSPLYPLVFRYVPSMQSMRFTYRGMIFYTLSISVMAGSFFNILCSGLRRIKFQMGIFLVFPVFLIAMLIYTARPFLDLVRNHPLQIDFRLWILMVSIGLFIFSLSIHKKINNIIFRNSIKILIPVWLVIELITNYSLPINRSRGSVYSPYETMWKDYGQKYPDIYDNELGLYRIENYTELLCTPYYFNTYSTHGYLSQATHPRRYYYLWHEHGGWYGYKYSRFWDLAYLPFWSPIYDLMGVRYFIAEDGAEAFPLPRETRGQGEWVEGTLLREDIGLDIGFSAEEMADWVISPGGTSYSHSIAKDGGLYLSLYLDGAGQEDEFIKMERMNINVDLKKYPIIELRYKVEDPMVQTIELVFGIDFNKDMVVDEYIRGIYPYPAATILDKFSYDVSARVREDHPDKEDYGLIAMELYPHKLWGADCKSSGKNRDYEFYIKNVKAYGYCPGNSDITGIGLYNIPDISHRRMAGGHLYLDNKPAVSLKMPIAPGWYEFSFEPISAGKFKLAIDEIEMQKWDGTDGVMIGEMRLYDSKGKMVKIDPFSLKASSTFWINHEKNLIDGDPETPWQSGCRIALKEMMETDTVQEIRRGVFINTNAMPRVFMIRQIKILNNIDELAEELHSMDFDPSRVLLLEDNPKDQIRIEAGEPDDKAEITSYSLNKVEITADIKTAGYLVLTDTYLPGWSVTVNGRSREILRAYGYFRAVALDEGYNKIIFRYFPPMLISGIVISSFSLVFLIVIGIRSSKYAKW